jgi:hypothetical protein
MVIGGKLESFDTNKPRELVPGQAHGSNPNDVTLFSREGVVFLSTILLHTIIMAAHY